MMEPIVLNYRLFYQETQRKSIKEMKNQRVKRKFGAQLTKVNVLRD